MSRAQHHSLPAKAHHPVPQHGHPAHHAPHPRGTPEHHGMASAQQHPLQHHHQHTLNQHAPAGSAAHHPVHAHPHQSPHHKPHAEPTHVVTFKTTFSSVANTVQSKWGVPAEVLTAQAALETGWGRHVKGNAYFGIKGKSPQGNSTSFATHEHVKGKDVLINDSFRAYKDLPEAADDYGRMLANNPRYKAAFVHKNDPEKFVHEIAKAGYATDPHYASKLIGIMRSHLRAPPPAVPAKMP